MVRYIRNAEIGDLLKQRRKSLHITMREVAEKSGVSTSHLSRIEQGGRFPSASVLRHIAEPLGYEEAELMVLAGYMSPMKSGIAEGGKGYRGGKLDPMVARVLSKEPIEVQRAVIKFLDIIKNMASSQGKKR